MQFGPTGNYKRYPALYFSIKGAADNRCYAAKSVNRLRRHSMKCLSKFNFDMKMNSYCFS
jgi:hypothetical protein